MTTKQAAEYLKVTERTIFRLIHRQAIQAEKFGPVWMIDRASLDAYYARNKDKTLTDPTRS